MKAAQLLAYGDAAEGIALREITEPSGPGPGEVLVQVKYAPINFSDLMVAWGVYDWKPSLPETLGNEGAGVVLEVGEGVEGFAPGMPVILPFMARSWRERLTVAAAQLTRLPLDADLQQAAMATINAVTVALLLDDFVRLVPGEALAYNAATSGLGHWVAGLASGRGVRTIGLVRRGDDIARVKHSGCEFVLLDENGALADGRLKELKVKLALDGVGGASTGRLATLLDPDAVLVAYGAASGQPMEISAQHLIFKRLVVRGFFEGHRENRERVPQTLRTLTKYLRPGGIRQPISAIYSIDRIKEAMAHAVKGGKVLLSFDG